ncbi:hypothetical protein PVAP13_9KG297500 [Panicum virgatum]|uniref:Uncharacterized protein n=2 Tax=Panicum virgatum TaxID=38727 RepID=A0A8T0NKS0_PANVG|nr:hypothetical protein PVAP13_9KG297500 [Panicum virgatum]
MSKVKPDANPQVKKKANMPQVKKKANIPQQKKNKNLPTDSTSETFDSLYKVLSVVEEKFNEKKKKRKEKKEKEKQVQVEEEKMEMDMGKEKQVQVEEKFNEKKKGRKEKMEKEKQVQVEEEGSEEAESGDEEGAEEGENSKVSVRRNILTPLNINLMLENIDKDEILKLLVKENEDTNGTEPSLDIDLIVRCFFVVVLDRLLLPQTTFYLSSGTLEAVTDLDKLKTVDWSHLIFENLKSSVAECPKDKTNLYQGVQMC